MAAPPQVRLVLNRCVISVLRLQQWLIYPKSRLYSGEGFLQNHAWIEQGICHAGEP